MRMTCTYLLLVGSLIAGGCAQSPTQPEPPMKAAAAPVAPAAAPTPARYPYLTKYVTGEANAAPLLVGIVRPERIEEIYRRCVYDETRARCTDSNRAEMNRYQYFLNSCNFHKTIVGAAACGNIAYDFGDNYRDFEAAALYYQAACDRGHTYSCPKALVALKKANLSKAP